jgi:hypothetical protein
MEHRENPLVLHVVGSEQMDYYTILHYQCLPSCLCVAGLHDIPTFYMTT